MKKSDMIDYIYEELLEIVDNRENSVESDKKYYQRKAAGLLDMLLGFGMLPPTRLKWVSELDPESPSKKENTWTPEGANYDHE